MKLPLRELASTDKCFDTPASATVLLLREQARSDRLRDQAHSDQGFGIPDCATPLLLGEQARSD